MNSAEPEIGPDQGEHIPEGFFASLDISSPKRIAIFLACLAASLAVALYPRITADLTPAATRALFILVFAACHR